jgi:hypothetical protein
MRIRQVWDLVSAIIEMPGSALVDSLRVTVAKAVFPMRVFSWINLKSDSIQFHGAPPPELRCHSRPGRDVIAWATIDARVPSTSDHTGLAKSGRANFAELEQQLRFGMDYGYAFSEFLDELYLFRRPNFFAQALSGYFSAGQRAFLAATAAYLSNRFGLPVPDWVHRPEFVLAEEWDPGRQPR